MQIFPSAGYQYFYERNTLLFVLFRLWAHCGAAVFVRSLPMKSRRRKKVGLWRSWYCSHTFMSLTQIAGQQMTATSLGSLLLLFVCSFLAAFKQASILNDQYDKSSGGKKPDVFLFWFLFLSSSSSSSLLLFKKFHSYQYRTREFSLFPFLFKDYAVINTLPASPAFRQ